MGEYEQLFSVYLKTLGGKDPFPPESLSELESLVRKKFVSTDICNKDKKSAHGAKTCKIELAWITELGIKQVHIEMEDKVNERLEKLDVKFDSMNPRIAMLAKHLMLKWAVSITDQTKDSPHLSSPSYMRHGYANYWGIPVPGFRSSDTEILPKIAKQGIKDVQNTLKELGLAAEHLSHDTSGWKSGHTLVTSFDIAKKIAKRYWASEIPWPIDMLIHSVFKTFAEKKLAFGLDNGKLHEQELLEYFETASYQELTEFLFLLYVATEDYDRDYHNDPINWKGIGKLLQSHYITDNKDPDLSDYLVRRIIGGKNFESIFEFRYLAVLAKVRKCILEWIETGKFTINVDLPSWNDEWKLTELMIDDKTITSLRDYNDKNIEPNLYHYEKGF